MYRMTDETRLLLNAYYEALFERLEARKDLVAAKIDCLLQDEIAKQKFEDFTGDKYTIYRNVCLFFIEERIELYNPICLKYTFDRIRPPEAIELGLRPDWFNSRGEFAALLETTRNKAEEDMTDERLRELADEIIKKMGAYPDNSIIIAYKAAPALNKLPDYVAARAIEAVIR